MVKPLNFNTMKKDYLPVTLADEKKTVLLVGAPTKAIMGELANMQASLSQLREDETDQEAVESLYDVCAKILSRNKGGIHVSADYLGEVFDIVDVMVFLDAYMDYVEEIGNSKN